MYFSIQPNIQFLELTNALYYIQALANLLNRTPSQHL